jgi:hypothetical protein
VYVETDFLVALVKAEDWLRESVLHALDEYDVHTSILAYAEVLVLFYDHDAAEYGIDAPRAITDLLELVPIRPATHEDAVLAATVFIDEHDLTPFDALHAGVAATADEAILSSEGAYDTVGLDRRPLEPENSG